MPFATHKTGQGGPLNRRACQGIAGRVRSLQGLYESGRFPVQLRSPQHIAGRIPSILRRGPDVTENQRPRDEMRA